MDPLLVFADVVLQLGEICALDDSVRVGDARVGSLQLSYCVSTRLDDVLSVSFWSELCGASCRYLGRWRLYDAKTGRRLYAEDLFLENRRNRLLELVNNNADFEHFYLNTDSNTVDLPEKFGWEQMSNVSLAEGGVWFSFDGDWPMRFPREALVSFVPWGEVGACLRSKGPLGRFSP